jgi:hypothetical protein
MTNSTSSKLIDPSGNWTMTASDQQGSKLLLSAIFNQVGPVVSANSFGNPGNPNLTCNPLNLTFSNGLVANVSTFSGTIAGGFGAMAFTGTLNDAGTAVTGTYAITNLNGCGGIGAAGTFTGAEVPSVTGNWTGTISPCNYNGQTAVCTPNGTAGNVGLTLNQNDSNGQVTGTFQVANLAGFSSGTIATNAPLDILSGLYMQLTMQDGNGKKYAIAGGPGNKQPGLGLDRTFKGIIVDTANATTGDTNTPSIGYFQILISH